MFKALVLQALYSLSDDACEFQIRDRLSFMRFLGLGLGDRVPEVKIGLGNLAYNFDRLAWPEARAAPA